MIEARERGVLDRPVEPGDDGGSGDGHRNVIASKARQFISPRREVWIASSLRSSQ
jgi:hypothetical protein